MRQTTPPKTKATTIRIPSSVFLFYRYYMNLAEKKRSLISELRDNGVLRTPAIIHAFEAVPRERFVLPDHREHAYANEPLPLLEGQTISQPLTIAAMLEALEPRLSNIILEVGAGSGYVAALLSAIVGSKGKVIAVERLHTLAEFARKNLSGYKNVRVIEADGSGGYPDAAPYDAILVSAAAPDVPGPLVAQLKEGGRLVVTVRDELYKITKQPDGVVKQFLGHYAFVPLRGKHGYASR